MKKRTGYFGLGETSECLQWTYEQLIRNVTGELIVSIGRGKFNDEVSKWVRICCAWAIYHDNGM
jgi:hypothetical protein